MTQKQEQAVQRLIQECNFKPATAKAYIRFKGKCGYCGVELIGGKVNYMAGTIDHLLPRTKYPELIEEEENYILCCVTCNSLKGTLDVLLPGEDPIGMVKNKKDELIGRVKQTLDGKNAEYDQIRIAVEKIVRDGNM